MGAAIFEAGYSIIKVEDKATGIVRTMTPVTEPAFELLFKTHFKGLYGYAYTILKDEVMAEEIVQQVFYKLWEKRNYLEIDTSPKAYLYKSVYHDSLNYLKHQKVKAAYAGHMARHADKETENASGKLLSGELKAKLHAAMNELPEQCRTIFQLSRYEGLKYQEIANVLGLSVKTIENQMGKALKILRTRLSDYLPVIILLFTS